MIPIPLNTPEKQNAPLVKELLAEIEQMVTRPGGLSETHSIEAMESQLAHFGGFRHGIGVKSGSAALEIGIRALNLPKDSQIITPALSYGATAQAILFNGLTPVFADVDPDTGCLDEKTVARSLTPKVRAVLAVDLLGRQAPLAALRRFCQRQGLYLLEDGAQSIGVPNGDPDLFFASFNPSKPCGAWGNAGAILTDDPELATRMREIRNQGGLLRDDCRRVGTNGWIDPIQARVVSHKLPRLRNWMKLRQALALAYWRALEPWQLRRGLILPPLPSRGTTHNWFRFTIQVENRDKFREDMDRGGIATGRVYAPPLPHQPLFAPYARGSYPGAERLSTHGVHLPIFPEMTGKQLETVVERVGQCLRPNSISFSMNP